MHRGGSVASPHGLSCPRSAPARQHLRRRVPLPRLRSVSAWGGPGAGSGATSAPGGQAQVPAQPPLPSHLLSSERLGPRGQGHRTGSSPPAGRCWREEGEAGKGAGAWPPSPSFPWSALHGGQECVHVRKNAHMWLRLHASVCACRVCTVHVSIDVRWCGHVCAHVCACGG